MKRELLRWVFNYCLWWNELKIWGVRLDFIIMGDGEVNYVICWLFVNGCVNMLKWIELVLFIIFIMYM